jgi:hypothetical protein
MVWTRSYKRKVTLAQNILTKLNRKEPDPIKKKKNEPERHFISVKSGKEFYLQSGSKIGSIHELSMMLDTISDNDYKFHVNLEKNDFANWIRDVFHETELAEKISAVTDRKDFQITLLKHVMVRRGD